MLKERITICGNGFQIRKGNADQERRAFYTTFSLKDADVDRNQGQPVGYWDAMNHATQPIAANSCVCVWEEKQGSVEESYEFYIGNGNAKPRLQWSITKDSHYGEYAHMVKLKWIDHTRDRIHKKHIWLKDEQTGRTYRFLREYIEPDEKEEDRYIIDILPGTADVHRLVIEGNELLLQKYLIVR